MYLTRIQLDLTKTKTMQALVAPKLFHGAIECAEPEGRTRKLRSEEHTSELQSLKRISYAVFCLKKNTN